MPHEPPVDAEVRVVDLPHGGHLTIRPIRPSDAPALGELYDDLSPDDRIRRFFSAFRPPEALLERWATVGERGGARIVAVTDDGEIVGEAGYELLDDGDGELDITVARRARGWVGPYLLDALIDLAGARGVPNLEAEVLLANRQMLALARARGFVALAHDEPCVVRLAIGTTEHPAAWPGPARGPRVLVVGRSSRWPGEEVAAGVGLEVLVWPVDDPLGVAGATPGAALLAGADAVVVVVPAGAVVPSGFGEELHRRCPGPACFVQPAAGTVAVAADEPVMVLSPDAHDAVLALADALGHPVDLPQRRSRSAGGPGAEPTG